MSKAEKGREKAVALRVKFILCFVR